MALDGINKNNPYQYMNPAQMNAMFGTQGGQAGGVNANPFNGQAPSGVNGVQGGSNPFAVGGAAQTTTTGGASFQGTQLNSELFHSNYGKGLAPQNYIDSAYAGTYNGKQNMVRQLGIA